VTLLFHPQQGVEAFTKTLSTTTWCGRELSSFYTIPVLLDNHRFTNNLYLEYIKISQNSIVKKRHK